MEEDDNAAVPVSDKEARKKSRRVKAEMKLNPGDGITEGSDSLMKDRLKTGQSQMAESIVHLDRRKYTGLQNVTSIRVATDENEAKRRVQDENMRRDRLMKLQTEALSSAKANAAIEMKWAELLEKEIPQELHHEIQTQLVSCNAIIRSKDDLITEFQRQLRSKDEEYVRTLRQQVLFLFILSSLNLNIVYFCFLFLYISS